MSFLIAYNVEYMVCSRHLKPGIDWQLWENQSLDYYKKKGTLKKEKESGWYYIKKHTTNK